MRKFVKTTALISILVLLFGCSRTTRNRNLQTPNLNPSLQTPNSMAPGTRTPSTRTPTTPTTPGTMVPGTETPFSMAPGQTPRTQVPNTIVPGTVTPGTATTNQKASVGGLYLGDGKAEVKAALGTKYRESTVTDKTLLGEPYLKWAYNKTTVLIGKTSGKVYQIETSDSALSTNLNIKVGDSYQTVNTKYKGYSIMKNVRGRNTKGVNTNWYQMADNSVLIINFNASTNTNTNVKNNAKVKSIRLTYQKLIV